MSKLCNLTREMAENLVRRTLTDKEFKAIHVPFDSNFQSKRFNVNLSLCNSQVIGAIDTCSCVNLISHNLIERLNPEWRKLPDAGEVRLSSHTGHTIRWEATKWIPLDFGPQIQTILAKFVISHDKNQLLLGAEIVQDNGLSLVSLEKVDGSFRYEITFPKRLSKRGSFEHVPLEIEKREIGKVSCISDSDRTRSTLTSNAPEPTEKGDLGAFRQTTFVVHAFSLEPNTTAVAHFRLPKDYSSSQVIITNVLDHSLNKEDASKCLVLPSISQVIKYGMTKVGKALVRNCSSIPVRINGGQLLAAWETSKISDELFPTELIQDEESKKTFRKK